MPQPTRTTSVSSPATQTTTTTAMATGNLNSLLGTPTERGINREVYIAAKAQTGTQTAGTGTAEDPLDGGTQAKFDAIFTLYANAGTPDITFILTSGVFHTKSGVRLGDRCRIKGQGKYSTTVFQDDVGGAGPTYSMPITQRSANSSGLGVSDLTIDAGYSRLRGTYPNGRFNGAQLTGRGSFFDNVRVINSGSDTSETFPLAIQSDTVPNKIDDAWIDRCTVELGGPFQTAVNLTHTAANPADLSTYAKGGKITRCYVNGAKISMGIPGGFDGALLHGNVISDFTEEGFYQDSFAYRNIIIAHNLVTSPGTSGNKSGVVSNLSATGTGLQIIDNLFECNCFAVALASPQVNAIIARNRMRRVAGSNNMAINLIGSQVVNTLVADNIIDDTWSNPIKIGNTSVGTIFRNNRTPSGVLYVPDSVAGLTFATLPASPPAGTTEYVSDSNTAVWGAQITGTGANKVLAFYNGTIWTVAGK